MISNKNEKFDNLIKQNILFTNILNDKYTIVGEENKAVLISFPNRAITSNIYTIYDDTLKKNYYYIYNNDKIMTYVDGDIFFNQFDVNIVASSNYSAYNKLYKTTDNKLYFLINNLMMYLTASRKNYSLELHTTADTNSALIWVSE